MSEAAPHSVVSDGENAVDTLNALREQGANQIDPVRFHFLETLARRLGEQQGAARQVLEARLAEGLTAYRQRMESRRAQAEAAATAAVEHFPHAAENLQRLVETGDTGSLRRTIDRLKRTGKPSPLKELTALLGQHPSAEATADARAEATSPAVPAPVLAPLASMADIAPQAELKSVRYFRDTWSRLATDQRVSQALEREPENAGPLNSHLLILRALKLMRDTAPDYLNRFMSYADTLLWLDAASAAAPPAKVASPSEEAKPKKKSSRTKTR